MPLTLSAQDEEPEEMLVTLQVQHIGNFEMPALIQHNEVYLPVMDLFNLLKIKNVPSESLDSVSGFFVDPAHTFLIDHKNHIIYYGEKSFSIDSGALLKNESGLYLQSTRFGEVFGLDCVFQFRSLSVVVTSAVELPAMREVRLEQLRKNLATLKGEKKADTTIGRTKQLFNLSSADWSLFTTEELGRGIQTRFNIALGGAFAGGESQMSYNYNSREAASARQLFYRWRYVDNDRKVFRQASVGKFFPSSIASIFNSLNGFHITNMPTSYRRSFGTYRISNKTEPWWTVELYVNNVLVNYVKADASGFYSFDVPLVYGNSLVTLHFYGPWGEERTLEENINIPFNFIPKNELEYNVTGGILEDGERSRFTRLNANYGLGNAITVGAGVEYLSSIEKNKSIPFLNTALRLGSRVLLSGEYAHGVRYKSVLSYSLPASLQLEVNYVKYHKDQQAIKFSYLEERKAMVSMPFKFNDVFAFSRLTLNQFLLPKTKLTSAELLFSGVFSGISANLRNYYMIDQRKQAYSYSNLSVGFRLPYRIRMTPQFQYDYSRGAFSLIKNELEKSVRNNKGFVNLSYERSFVSDISMFALSFRYNFSFAQAVFSARRRNQDISLMQSARGSIVYDAKSKIITPTSDYNVGRGGVIVIPFLDLNNNGKKDKGEPGVTGLNLRINGRHIQRVGKDSTIQILGLEPYSKYLVELDPTSFENISWQIKNKAVSIYIEPNLLKTLFVPVQVAGEVSGKVWVETATGLKGAERILLNICSPDGTLVAKALTEPDGYFNYLGLPPGSYTIKADPTQLSRLRLSASEAVAFTIKPGVDGDIVDDLRVVLSQE